VFAERGKPDFVRVPASRGHRAGEGRLVVSRRITGKNDPFEFFFADLPGERARVKPRPESWNPDLRASCRLAA